MADTKAPQEMYKAADKLARELESAHDSMWIPGNIDNTTDLVQYKKLESDLWNLVIEYEELAAKGGEFKL